MVSSTTDASIPRTAAKRIGIFDVVRGIALVSMVLFHLCYDLVYLKGLDLVWFPGTVQIFWSRATACTFLFVAGCMCCLSRNNLKRAGIYAAVALAIFVITSLAGVDTAISFGIIFCMAASTFVYWCLEKLNLAPKGYLCAIVLLVLFAITFDLPRGQIGIGGFVVDVPRAPYDSGLLSWAGFLAPGFSSGDYYPLLPYLFMYLSGSACGAAWKEAGYPEWARNAKLEPLNWLGNHSLIVYVLHQPLILAILSLI